MPYAYKPGPNGVEVLEFRTADTFDIRFLGKTAAFWDKTVDAIRSERGAWAGQRRPQDLVAMD